MQQKQENTKPGKTLAGLYIQRRLEERRQKKNVVEVQAITE